MKTKSKYAAFKRSQLLMAIHHAETKLLLWKNADPRRPAVEKDRIEMFTALREKDEEILRRWRLAHIVTEDDR